jgi:NAD(P)-dependent dehydrogenase (short-subunit alcohol dehydrogenase family)
MNNPVIVITGALTGIGRATALAFAKNGARLVLSGRREAEGKALEVELQKLGAEAVFVQADVRHDEEVRRLIDQAVARFGRLDAAVNNAGTEGQPGPIVNQTAESYAATFDTNVLGILLSLKHELRVMTAQKSGSIINISSTYGHKGAAYASVYSASKHAVEGFTKSVALEAASSGVRVNAVAPGPTDTGMLDRFTGTPREQGRAGLRRAAGPVRQTRRNREHNTVPGLGRCVLCDRADRLCRWRQIRRLMPPLTQSHSTRHQERRHDHSKQSLRQDRAGHRCLSRHRPRDRSGARAGRCSGDRSHGSGEKEATAVVTDVRNTGGKAQKVAADLRTADGPHQSRS